MSSYIQSDIINTLASVRLSSFIPCRRGFTSFKTCVCSDAPHITQHTQDFESHPCFTKITFEVSSVGVSAPSVCWVTEYLKVISLEQKWSHLNEVMVRVITILSIFMLVRWISSSSWCFYFNLCQKTNPFPLRLSQSVCSEPDVKVGVSLLFFSSVLINISRSSVFFLPWNCYCETPALTRAFSIYIKTSNTVTETEKSLRNNEHWTSTLFTDSEQDWKTSIAKKINRPHSQL